MTTLAKPTIIIAAIAAETATMVASRPRQHSTAFHRIVSSRLRQPVGTLASTEQLLTQRAELPAEHSDRDKLRARAIEMNLPMARKLARRYAGRGELLEDLGQVAAVALIKAVDGFDPSRKVPFAGYAIPTILGSLKRHFRDSAWAMRVPRSTQELARAVATATAELSQRWGHSPTSAELADHLGVSLDDLQVAVGAWQAYSLASLNELHGDKDGGELIDLIGDIDPGYAGVDESVTLRPLFAALPLRERRILTMRFRGYMTQTEIADEVGLSQMHVSRLLRRSLAGLRAAMLA